MDHLTVASLEFLLAKLVLAVPYDDGALSVGAMPVARPEAIAAIPAAKALLAVLAGVQEWLITLRILAYLCARSVRYMTG